MNERFTQKGTDIEIAFREFKEKTGFSHVVGIIGGSNKEDDSKHTNFLYQGLSLVKKRLGKFAILSGGTREGIPEVALNVARLLELPTIGVFPENAQKYAAFEKLDFPISVEPSALSELTWGTETPTLVSIPDVFILIGGEWGTLTEVSMIIKRNKSRADKKEQIIPIITVAESGKLADNIEKLLDVFSTPKGSCIKIEKPTQLAQLIIAIIKNQD